MEFTIHDLRFTRSSGGPQLCRRSATACGQQPKHGTQQELHPRTLNLGPLGHGLGIVHPSTTSKVQHSTPFQSLVNRKSHIVNYFVFLLSCLLASNVFSQALTLDKSTFPGGGGGVSSDHYFTVEDTVGEAVTGSASGGGFSVASGYTAAVSFLNTPPTAFFQSVTTHKNVPLGITLTATDPDGDFLNYTVTVDPLHGYLTGTPPNLTYTPFMNYTGMDALQFTVADNHGALSAEATILITVSPVNNAPAAFPQSVTTAEELPLAIVLTATDADGDPITYHVAAMPAHGTLTGVSPNVTYTPAPNFNGVDSFTFTANDGALNSIPATVVVVVTPATDVAPAAFLQPLLLPTGLAPWAVATGQLTGDKKLDLAVANSESNTVSIFLGDGLGGFTNVPAVSVGAHPSAVVIADFNLDSLGDLAVANADDNTISILTGHGDGTFDLPVTIPVGQHPVALCAANLNGDTNLDLIVANYDSGSISILLGSPAGFAAPINYSLAVGINTVATGDFNKDGKLDVIVANSSSGTITLLLGDGAGAFISTNSFPAGPLAIGLAIGDFNGDKKLDVATANQTANTVTVLLGNGKGLFTNTITCASGTNPVAIAVVDFNKDTKLDLAVANWSGNSVDLLNGNGDGTFTYYFGDPATHYVVGNQPVALAVGDFDADQNSDLAVAVSGDDHVALLMNNFTPKAFKQTFVVLEDAATPIVLSAQGGPPLNFTLLTTPTNGTLTGTAPGLTYTPNTDYYGKDSFSYVVDDGFKTSKVATVTLSVTAVNDAPAFTLLTHEVVIAEDSPKQTVVVAAGLSPGPANELAQNLIFLVSNDATNLFSVQPKLTVIKTNATGILTFTPALNAYGVAHVALQLQDTGGTANGGIDRSPIQTITITITPVDDAPVIGRVTIPSMLENGSVVVNFSVTDVETSPDSLSYSVAGTNAILFANPATNFVFGGSGTNRTLTITPGLHENGADHLTLVVSDGVNTTLKTNIAVSVTAVNDAPSFEINTATYGTEKTVAHNSPLVTLPNFAINRSPGPANESSQTLSFIVSTATPGYFTTQPAVNASGTLTFKPKAGTPNGTQALVAVRIKDSGSGTLPSVNLSAAQNYTITITNP